MNPRATSVTLMLAKSLLVLAASCAVACSDARTQGSAGGAGSAGLAMSGAAGTANRGGETSGDPVVVPAGLAVAAQANNNSVFKVIALTLRQGTSDAEVYAAVKNVGDGAGCNASFSVTLYDKDGVNVGNGISGLMVRRFFQLTDGSGNVAGCVAPGDVTMVALTNLYLDIPIEEVARVEYMSQYWALPNVVSIAGASLEQVNAVTIGTGAKYTGVLVNGLDTPLTGPTVAVFPLDASGRPLGVAYGASSVVLPPGGTWNFETNVVSDAGVRFDAYPLGGP